jgi:metal-responsive CopG/Arc/MetJ family transcriptional regulator
MPPKCKGRGEWVYVGLPKEIVDIIDKVVESRKWGFRSRNDHVIEAVKTDLRSRGLYP